MRWLALLTLVLASSSCDSGSSCDSTPGTLGGECHVETAAGQCVDFASLGTTDLASVKANCTMLGGTFDSTTCATADRVGTCMVPLTDVALGIDCSANASIQERYYASKYTVTTAMQACTMVGGAVFTPN